MDEDPPPVTYQPLLVEDGSIGAEEGRPARLLEDKESIVISSTCPDPSVELCKCDKPAKKIKMGAETWPTRKICIELFPRIILCYVSHFSVFQSGHLEHSAQIDL